MRALYEKSVPKSTPLFLAKANMIIDCLLRNGYEFTGERPRYVQAWEILAKRPFAVEEGERCTMSRFCSTITANERRTAWWEVEEQVEVRWVGREGGGVEEVGDRG
jgi:hypothetical protein